MHFKKCFRNSFILVQRIPRYVLLLEDLLRHTEEDHPDYKPLTLVIEIIKVFFFFLVQNLI